jgi:hypothetical protein
VHLAKLRFTGQAEFSVGSVGIAGARSGAEASGSEIKAAKQKAGQIYAERGAFTTAARAIPTQAIIDAGFNHE